MRKFLALFLAAWIILSLCGCGTAQAQADALLTSLLQAQQSLNSYAALRANKAEDVFHVQSADDFCWNGQNTVWFMIPMDASPDDILAADAMGSICQACGWRYEKRELDGKTVTPTALLTQAVQSGDVGAMVFTQLQAYTADYVQAAADAGIIVLCIDPDCPVPDAGSIAADGAALGRETYELICAWLDTQETDDQRLSVAINAWSSENTASVWSEELAQCLADSDTLFNSGLAFTDKGNAVFDDSYLWAKQVMADAPETRIFCCYTPEAAYGVCYYLEQYCADRALDLSGFCVVWVGQDADSSTYLSVSRDNSSYTAARGFVEAHDCPWLTGARLAYQILGIACGSELPVSLADAFAVLSENDLSIPDSFSGWLWGLDAAAGITAYASFSTEDDGILSHTDMPMADMMQAAE